MLVSLVSLLAAASAVTAQTSNAPVTTDNPAGAKYVATLPTKDGSSLAGSIEGSTADGGKGVRFNVHFSGLPATGGPFMYHIHAKPVPADGNCTGAGAHLDPYHYGEDKKCDASKPEICQTGDLSGKYGTFEGNTFAASYVDLYSSTSPSDPAFFGGVSFVLHLANKTRIGCANFHLVSDGETSSSASSSPGYPTGSMPVPIASTPVPVSTPASAGYAMPTGYPIGNGTVVAPSPTASSPFHSSSPRPSEFPGAAPKLACSAGVLLAAAAAAAAFIF
ncbi:Cell surface superoxide dismutase [Exserohilum turcicum]|uniref:superoxide dismutase n=1 Tax=Exserohilum turcicum (strain 28A) TaxID=671987 RepID=R0IA27_EXST2|nr:uncharacterized protein SETTUDRAFT_97015 [Exserohilum turcica Et28A]EOA82166.1 hypothetical protein SETTUDRAFT_97015 [Exserohilum turcica Et28A]